ncbi:DUF6069 family protein [Haloarcula sp. S1CR25-12]|uniref:DUF6069 family protein n=1 Tax=Haloarcula saliterrae TaxID=2950534 RepID=A0ABU2F974_9EURY|nr:DUF6069 family protein [Haloarcula sp. S1CR25-12]MDS0258827.1 DUF6069 family protein [Haloarcula sp. S1CR25-12]
MSTVTSRYPVATSGGELARRTAGGVLVAVVSALVVAGIAGALGLELGVSGPASPFGAVPIVTSTVVAGVGAAVVYAATARFTDRPVRNFTALAVAVFVVMLVPVFAAAPSLGLSAVGQLTLVVIHAVVAVPLVAFVVGAVQL